MALDAETAADGLIRKVQRALGKGSPAALLASLLYARDGLSGLEGLPSDWLSANAREAMHLLELRTTPQGHPAYRRVCLEMHRLIAEEAGHRVIAEMLRFADHTTYDLERLESERRTEARRVARR